MGCGASTAANSSADGPAPVKCEASANPGSPGAGEGENKQKTFRARRLSIDQTADPKTDRHRRLSVYGGPAKGAHQIDYTPPLPTCGSAPGTPGPPPPASAAPSHPERGRAGADASRCLA